ncbi:anti-anti-sigma factor [Cnuella takakiae]|uniref:Anti-anti-sigma factor n=1 Tax=Cnuella takakiae TaxID=1302690 RepID=A0A1M5IMC7_9BACT|nr:STAS domain-containing protein [Cnuella takakiae]OLY92233.1 anti-anti-sigma factor [Cnuella takakiae]SHG29199.1 anti-anti-sigma factor [Cnuella takakiae]
MEVKTSTKEKFHAISVVAPVLSANMAADLRNQLQPLLQQEIKNVVLNLSDLNTLDEAAAETLVKIQQHFYDNNASFVVCCLQPSVEAALDSMELLELMNVTPTESEAWDIVQMEEIERELLGDEENF